MSSKKADYGIDAPIVVRNLFLIGGISFLLGILLHFIKIKNFHIDLSPIFLPIGAMILLTSFLMFNYSRSGKYKHRDRMISMIDWKGNEKVLDIGTGKGLLMIGAAKMLENGIATGVDVWNPKDLSENDMENARVNVLRELVSHKTVIKTDDVRKLSFPDNQFDVVLSNLCLHNIGDKAGRKKACKEIVRVLKPGGIALLSDFKCNDEYIKTLKKEGLKVEVKGKYWFDTFPPLSVIYARKPIG